MIVPERKIRITVSDIVTDFRHHFFNPSDCPDIHKSYFDAMSKLDGILLIFSEGKIARFINAYKDELRQLGRILGLTINQAEINGSEPKTPDYVAQTKDDDAVAMAVQS